MCKKCGIAAGRGRSRYHPARAITHLVKRLTSGNHRRPDRPVWRILLYIVGFASFEYAVIPFLKIRLDCGRIAEPCNPAGFTGSQLRAGQHQRKTLSGKNRANGSSLLFAVLRKGNVGTARMRARDAPFRFAMANQPNLT